MIIRHVVAQDNVAGNGRVIDPGRARHAVVVAGRVADLSGEVDPRTHLNLDYADHRLDWCVVVERLERGAAVARDGEGFIWARVSVSHYGRLGPVDVNARRLAWLQSRRRPA